MFRIPAGLTLLILATTHASAQEAPSAPVWLEVARVGGTRIALDSVSMYRMGDSSFFAPTLITFSDTLEAESGERFDREIDVEELDCGRARVRTHAALLMAGDSMVATLPRDPRWAPVTERALPLLRLRCTFLLGSFLMATAPIARVEQVDARPRLGNPSEVRRAMERLYPVFVRSGRPEGTIMLDFVIDAEGRAAPQSLRVVWSDIPRPEARQIAARLLPTFRFHPARLGGRAVPVRVQVPLTFQADGVPLFPDPRRETRGSSHRWPGEW